MGGHLLSPLPSGQRHLFGSGAGMSKAKHTSGPWVRDRESGFDCDVRAANGRKIAAVNVQNQPKSKEGWAKRKAENEANAILIAAAPELLEALQAAKNSLVAFKFQPGDANCWEPHDEANLALVDAAIAKVLGEQSHE